MRAQLRTQQPTRDGTNQKRADEIRIDIAKAEMKQASHPGQDHGMNDVRADHDFGREAVEQKQKHHDDAA